MTPLKPERWGDFASAATPPLLLALFGTCGMALTVHANFTDVARLLIEPFGLERYVDSGIIRLQILISAVGAIYFGITWSAVTIETQYAEILTPPVGGALRWSALNGARGVVRTYEDIRRVAATRDELADRLEFLRICLLRERVHVLAIISWLLPTLGFIGTVVGISAAVSEMGRLSMANPDGSFAHNIDGVLAGLHIAFDTTLVGLLCAIPMVFGETLLRHRMMRVHEMIYCAILYSGNASSLGKHGG